jgi:hypothetical protein
MNNQLTLFLIAVAVIAALLFGCSDGADEATMAAGARNEHQECLRSHGDCGRVEP